MIHAADDFDAIRARVLELQSERADNLATRRCKACGERHGGNHLDSCCYTGIVVEDELA